MDELDSGIARVLAMLDGVASPQTELRFTEEVAYGTGGLPAQVGRLHSLAEYRARFADLVTRGWPWINLHAVGLLAGKLLLAVELPNHSPSGVLRTSVNVSGPTSAVKSRGYVLDDLLRLDAG